MQHRFDFLLGKRNENELNILIVLNRKFKKSNLEKLRHISDYTIFADGACNYFFNFYSNDVNVILFRL